VDPATVNRPWRKICETEKTEKNDNLDSQPIQSALIVKEWHLFMTLKTVLIFKG
jgi:hypothetical protein